MRAMMFPPKLDGGHLVRLRRSRPKRFIALVSWLRARGVTDKEILAAMTASCEVINAIGQGAPR